MDAAFTVADPLAPISPTTVQTELGRVECASFGQGPAILALHGAMGGWQQSAILAMTVGPPGFRYLAVSRPGYLGTPLSSGCRTEEQADLLAALLEPSNIDTAAVIGGRHVSIFTHRQLVRERVGAFLATHAPAAGAVAMPAQSQSATRAAGAM
ncbi:MAG: hypothetical protein JRI23_00675 [Deltaproteobacteria bacterium]|nr:hypothetical protein [Deltaproteobacteria bacterium]MBW2529964.1 hypothetical protein [Deltaproteobacteria bacterium]